MPSKSFKIGTFAWNGANSRVTENWKQALELSKALLALGESGQLFITLAQNSADTAQSGLFLHGGVGQAGAFAAAAVRGKCGKCCWVPELD